MSAPPRVAILTVSDRCSRGEAVDRSGPAMMQIAREQLGATISAEACVPDDAELIRAQILEWIGSEPAPDLVLTTGGTGLAPRDVTPEAVDALLERRAPGLMELVRRRGAESTPHASLSRGVAGMIGRTLVITLPGSERGARDSLVALLEVLPHAISQVRGQQHDHDG